MMPSPRTRGCFRHVPRNASGIEAFPAHAGMFPLKRPKTLVKPRLPRARGDVSEHHGGVKMDMQPSPRTRGCFQH